MENEFSSISDLKYVRNKRINTTVQWCNKDHKPCIYCNCSDGIYQETKDNKDQKCPYINPDIKVRIDMVINNKPFFHFSKYTNVEQGWFDIIDGVYIPEGTFVKIHSSNIKYDQRMGYVSHPIKYEYSGYTGLYEYYHLIFMKKPEKVYDLRYTALDYGKMGIICSCDQYDKISNHFGTLNKKAMLEIIKETPKLKEKAALYYFHNYTSSFYYSPGDLVRVQMKTGGGWNDYYSVGFLDEYGQIWTTLDEKTRKPIEEIENNIIRSIGSVELLVHQGKQTDLAIQLDQRYNYNMKHPIKTKIITECYQLFVMVPGEKFGWFIYIVLMILLVFTLQRYTGWVLCTLSWFYIRSNLRSKYIRKKEK